MNTISDAIYLWYNFELLEVEFDLTSSNFNKTIIKGIIELKKCKGEYENSNARILAQQILQDEALYEMNQFVFFLNIWAISVIKLAQLMEAKVLLSTINKYKISDLDLKAFILNTNGFYESALGHKVNREILLLKCLEIITKNSKIYELQLLIYLRFLATLGRLNEAKTLIDNLKSEHSLLIRKIILFDNFFQTHQSEKTLALIKSITPTESETYSALNLTHLNRAYQSLTGDLIKDPKSYNINDSEISFSVKWHICNYYLKYKNPVKALAWSKHFSIEHKIGIKKNNLVEYTLIRAELSNHHQETANRLLNDKIKAGSPHYLDNFFYARVELLKGNVKAAENLFKTVFEHCLYYDAINRLYFELDLSCELNKKQIIYLLRTSFDCKPKYFNAMQFIEIESKIDSNSIIGKSKSIIQLKKMIKKYADANSTILINGETGVGKEEVAQNLHLTSKRKDKPFLVINCGAISETLLYSELFGHTKGSYTGAMKDQSGIFEAAGEGVVFLDEIGEISEQVQVALLRILESNEIKPLGSTISKPIFCKIIAATNKDLKFKVENGTFREDLYFRLNRLEIMVPPLRERGQDIIELAEYFLRHNRSDDKQPKLSAAVQSLMLEYSWPGNVRQLKNEIEKSRLNHSDKLFYDVEDFSFLNPHEFKNKINIKQIEEEKSQFTYKATPTEPSIKSSIQSIINNEKTLLRRREKIKTLFKEAKNLSRSEISKTLNVSLGTITSDLKNLEEEGFIKRIKPSASSRTHYFQLNQN